MSIALSDPPFDLSPPLQPLSKICQAIAASAGALGVSNDEDGKSLLDAAASPDEGVNLEVLADHEYMDGAKPWKVYALWLADKGMVSPEDIFDYMGAGRIRWHTKYLEVYSKTWETLAKSAVARAETKRQILTPLSARMFALRQEFLDLLAVSEDNVAELILSSFPGAPEELPLAPGMEEIERRLVEWITSSASLADLLSLTRAENGLPAKWINPIVLRHTPLVADESAFLRLAPLWTHGGAGAALKNERLSDKAGGPLLDYAIQTVHMEDPSTDTLGIIDALRARGVVLNEEQIQRLWVAESIRVPGVSPGSPNTLAGIPEVCANEEFRELLWEYPGVRRAVLGSVSGPVWAKMVTMAEADPDTRWKLDLTIAAVKEWQIADLKREDLTALVGSTDGEIREAALGVIARMPRKVEPPGKSVRGQGR